jgi:hypothetical protein
MQLHFRIKYKLTCPFKQCTGLDILHGVGSNMAEATRFGWFILPEHKGMQHMCSQLMALCRQTAIAHSHSLRIRRYLRSSTNKSNKMFTARQRSRSMNSSPVHSCLSTKPVAPTDKCKPHKGIREFKVEMAKLRPPAP